MMATDTDLSLTSEDAQSELIFKDIEKFDFTFFIFLCGESAPDCKWDCTSETLTIKLKEVMDQEEYVRQVKEIKDLIKALRCCFKETYILSDEEMKIADDFCKDTNLLGQFGDVLVDADLNKSRERKLIIMASNDHYNMFTNLKHRFELKIGRKKTTRLSRHESYVPPSSDKKGTFVTFEKINVVIRTDNLENIDGKVDGIVNPTNDKFGSKGQVALFISDKGGEPYKQERKELLSTLRPSPKACFITRGGKLKPKYVLHAVCPNIQACTQTDIDDTIFETVYNCLERAEDEELDSVAFPFLYTGHGNISVDLCAIPYAYAVIEFSRKRVNTFVVNTIYFVDLDETKSNTLIDHFAELVPKSTNQLLELPVNKQFEDSTRTDMLSLGNLADAECGDTNTKLHCTAKENVFYEKSLSSTEKKVCVQIKKGDIREEQVDVLICPEIADTKYGGRLAVAVKCAYRKLFHSQTLKKPVKSKRKIVATTDCHNIYNTCSIYIYLVQTSVYHTDADKEKLENSIKEVFQTLKKNRGRNIRKIAFPLFGIEDVSDEGLVQECCKIMAVSKTIVGNMKSM